MQCIAGVHEPACVPCRLLYPRLHAAQLPSSSDDPKPEGRFRPWLVAKRQPSDFAKGNAGHNPRSQSSNRSVWGASLGRAEVYQRQATRLRGGLNPSKADLGLPGCKQLWPEPYPRESRTLPRAGTSRN